ncbi:hypothetical protein [Candidatus Chloroploca sp. Khr17]|uniref:hypothetical protein n=1 Tax=Candidatus Chloroploca sp. Khr17 TaxID=2496869 RepID=UPI00101C0C95|nr:hypothetical protein [Candidatus Chloroploca sp. Khr17]
MMALSVTIKGYLLLRADQKPKKDWNEDTFTSSLGEDYIHHVAYEHNIFVIVRSKVHTEQIKSGEVLAKTAKEMDMWLYGAWEKSYRQRRFVWEAKLIADRTSSEAYKNLVAEYVSQGMFRFIDEEYAREVPDAGMLGYILSGSSSAIVAQINQSMKEPQRHRKLKDSDYLHSHNPVENFTDIYQSIHNRTASKNKIRLFHLLLSFNFS